MRAPRDKILTRQNEELELVVGPEGVLVGFGSLLEVVPVVPDHSQLVRDVFGVLTGVFLL